MKLNIYTRSKVFVAMSGGVDSSVAAALLKNLPAGRQDKRYNVVGVHIKCYNVDGCGERDVEDARRAAEVLDIPFYVFDFEKEYKREVVRYMVNGYKKGITPNPDVMCNKEIKFGLFLKKALAMGADYVATGHYVRIVRGGRLDISQHPTSNIFNLRQAKDLNKDQSYFLWTLTQNQLKHCLFPIGDYTKPQVRALARKFKLPNATKKDSQGICFLGQVSLPDFLQNYIKPRCGAVLNITGEKIGEHRGTHLYTIGQRHGLGIGGSKKPYYVADKNIKKNTVTVAEGDNHPALYKKEIELTDINFIIPEYSNILKNIGVLPVWVRVRYRQPLVRAELVSSIKYQVSGKKNLKDIGSGTSNLTLRFNKPIKFVAMGQSAVFYVKEGALSLSVYSGRSSDGFQMLGGGVIESAV